MYLSISSFLNISVIIPSLHLPIHPPIHLPIYPSTPYLFTHLFIHPSIHVPVHPLVQLSILPLIHPIYLAIHLSTPHPSIYAFIYSCTIPFIYLHHTHSHLAIHLPVYPTICPFTHLPVHPLTHLPTHPVSIYLSIHQFNPSTHPII